VFNGFDATGCRIDSQILGARRVLLDFLTEISHLELTYNVTAIPPVARIPHRMTFGEDIMCGGRIGESIGGKRR
jgi:hypothetical protein